MIARAATEGQRRPRFPLAASRRFENNYGLLKRLVNSVLAFSPPTRLALCAALAMAPLVSCASGVRTPGSARQGGNAIPANYPPTVVESAEHRETMRAEWLRALEAYGVPPERRKAPDLAPVTHVPQSILGIGPIPLARSGAEAPPDEERVRLFLRDFIAERAQLLGVSATALSLETVTDAGGLGKRYSYVQADYRHPIAPPDGRLDIIVSPRAEIIQISDTVIPFVDLPAEPRIARDAAAKSVLGTTFTYGDIAGRPQTVTVTDPEHVEVKRLVVLPERTPEALRIRLAWEVEAGSSLTWTVYVDAVTGETISTRQNFQT
jgi:hypothetical protein